MRSFSTAASAASASSASVAGTTGTNSRSSTQAKGAAAEESKNITPRAVDYAQWYQDVVYASDMVDASPVKGCAIIKPWGYAVWESLRDALDAAIKATGVSNAYFPLLIPQSFFSKEAAHVEGFAKECAVVTHHRLRAVPGGEGVEPDPEAELAEPLIVRPTSETVIWHTYGRWIHSHRDLPILLNQWANVVRWEMRTRPFLRTSEFLWQEGHTAHASEAEARERTTMMLNVYARVCEDLLALPTIPGAKSPSERFAGADDTYTLEAMMQNGWALQSATSHFLGQNFAKAFNVTFQDDDGKSNYVWATSWGASTRLLGALVMTHSDDVGLVLPPAVASQQVVVVPIVVKDPAQAASVTNACNQVVADLRKAGVRATFDGRTTMSAGAKYFEWERKGVPMRIEVGPRDVANGVVTLKQRIGGDRATLPLNADLPSAVKQKLAAIQQQMLATARTRLEQRTFRVSTYEEMSRIINAAGSDFSAGGFVLAPWYEDAANEAAIKEEIKATIRCYPFAHQEEARGAKCVYSGKPATHMALFARAY